jgi:hypothetical protein
MPTQPQEIPFEVLPPERPDEGFNLSRTLAWILDDMIPIPGTNFRIGLDPIIGLIPGLGDGSTTLASSLLLIHGLRDGVPRIVLVRMILNMLINALGGVIPGVGDVFSAWFKSNLRNYALLQKHAGSGRRSTTGDWIFVGVLVGGVFAMGLALSILVAMVVVRFFSWLFGA